MIIILQVAMIVFAFYTGTLYQKRKFLFGVKELAEDVMEEISGNRDGEFEPEEKVKEFEEADEKGKKEKIREILIAEGKMKMVTEIIDLF